MYNNNVFDEGTKGHKCSPYDLNKLGGQQYF